MSAAETRFVANGATTSTTCLMLMCVCLYLKMSKTGATIDYEEELEL